MLALAAGSLAAIGGGLLVAAMTFAVWLYSSPKAHAPADKLPLSDDLDQDEDRNSGLSRLTPLGNHASICVRRYSSLFSFSGPCIST